MSRPFRQVDVFASHPYSGNPLAVVAEAEGLSTEDMQAITRWNNLSETAFLLAPSHPDADYRVRIFTLDRELPFAGHPTLGACHAWLEGGGRPRQPGTMVQECGAGLVPLRRTPDGLAFAAPPLLRAGAVSEADQRRVVAILGIDLDQVVAMQWADNGPGWIGVLLDSAAAVLALEPRLDRAQRIDIGVAGRYPEGSDCAVEIRAFFTDEHGSLREDPVTGSLNASLAQWLLAEQHLRAPYRASQGTKLGRAGRIVVEQEADDNVWVGGATRTHVVGTID